MKTLVRRVVLVAAGAGLCAAAVLQAGQPPAKPADQPNVPAGHPAIIPPKPDKEWPVAKPADVASIDAILKAMYESNSGAPNEKRDWDRYVSLFLPDARMIPARLGGGGNGAGAIFLSIGDYVEANRTYFEKGGFFDSEVSRRVESYGNIAHVWSTYESRHRKEDPAPYIRGINSIQLLKDADRWWIVNVYWEYERPETPLPDKYLQPQQQ